MHFKIDWASLLVGRKFTVFALFYFVFEGNFQVRRFFCVMSLGSLYLEGLIFGILRFALYYLHDYYVWYSKVPNYFHSYKWTICMQLKQTDSKRKPEKIVPNFSSHFHGNCTTLDKQNSRTFHGQSQFSMTNIYSINQHSLTPFWTCTLLAKTFNGVIYDFYWVWVAVASEK